MIIGGSKKSVIENIEQNITTEKFNSKVEVNDATLSPAETSRLLAANLKRRQSARYAFNNWLARMIMNSTTKLINRHTEIIGLENLLGLENGAIVTSNHFSPLENTIVRQTLRQIGTKRLFVVSQATNLLAQGVVGYLLKYADTLPIGGDKEYMGREFPKQLQQLLNQQQFILIYPEQEMWFNYRKPRPPKRGAYYYAARFQVPIVSCFVEIIELPRRDNAEFNQTRYRMHVLPTIFPDTAKSARENSIAMMQQDYAQKKQAYEQAYGQPLNYQFSTSDIAGWRG
ncbi:1-acyl-sn-glycerol-3-phosphate acyltransferase [Loigolactobacillus jiayinensis]|uniref:1-acyl-sn-glycerol-3-phosphate acyltransferase n=1 Tax=Loigolactobacillus jiayinensis TaxID=2486016 RepID=A0ABW1RCG6_9LACO|nr:1-acyl-sn-glycerol-3-phosphate acyltransferase [Loigolactobacillus jiayinensis]